MRSQSGSRELRGGLAFALLFVASGGFIALGASLIGTVFAWPLLLAGVLVALAVPVILARRRRVTWTELRDVVIDSEDPFSGILSGIFTLWLAVWGGLSYGLWQGFALGAMTLVSILWGLVLWHLVSPQGQQLFVHIKTARNTGVASSFRHSGYDLVIAGDEVAGQICAYCLSPFERGDVVLFCPKCGLPHHFDCWSENAGCAAYGCNARGQPAPLRTGRSEASEQVPD